MTSLPVIIACSGLSLLLFSCAFAPINHQYEKAGTLKKGNVELAGNFTGYSLSAGGIESGSGAINNDYGFKVGYGISDKVDIKLRYERIVPSNMLKSGDFGNANSANFISIVPKVAIVPEKLAFLIPVSYYFFKNNFDRIESNGNFGSITPQLIYTFSNGSKKADFSMGVKADCLFMGGVGSVLFGATVGAGFSSDLSKWAIRPEVGASFIGAGAYLSYGIGMQFIIPKRKK